MHELDVSYINAEAADSTLETRTLVCFARFNKNTDPASCRGRTSNTLDDGFSKDMIKLRLPGSGLTDLKLKQCCLSPEGQCDARRDDKPCPWRTMAYKARATSRALAGGRPTSAQHQERRDRLGGSGPPPGEGGSSRGGLARKRPYGVVPTQLKMRPYAKIFARRARGAPLGIPNDTIERPRA
jgi:hypothetical protein